MKALTKGIFHLNPDIWAKDLNKFEKSFGNLIWVDFYNRSALLLCQTMHTKLFVIAISKLLFLPQGVVLYVWQKDKFRIN